MSSKNLSSKLIQGGVASPAKSKKSSEASFYDNILHYPDTKKGAEFVQDFASNESTAEFGHELEECKENFETVCRLCEPIEDEIIQSNKKKSATPAVVKSATNEKGETESIPISQWSGRYIFLGGFAGLLMITAMVVGASNAAIVMLASGEPVFLEAPYRAWLIGLIVPIAGASLKLPTSFIEQEVARKRYALAIVSFTAFSLGCWTFLYAAEYQGLSGGFDWESMLEPDNKSSLLVFFQLLSEVFASASFALCLESIYRIYCPDSYKRNPEFELISQRILELEAALKPLKAQKSTLHARIVTLENKRENYAAERVAAYFAEINRRQKFQ